MNFMWIELDNESQVSVSTKYFSLVEIGYIASNYYELDTSGSSFKISDTPVVLYIYFKLGSSIEVESQSLIENNLIKCIYAMMHSYCLRSASKDRKTPRSALPLLNIRPQVQLKRKSCAWLSMQIPI